DEPLSLDLVARPPAQPCSRDAPEPDSQSAHQPGPCDKAELRSRPSAQPGPRHGAQPPSRQPPEQISRPAAQLRAPPQAVDRPPRPGRLAHRGAEPLASRAARVAPQPPQSGGPYAARFPQQEGKREGAQEAFPRQDQELEPARTRPEKTRCGH